jgi:hypothetical protein
MDLGYMEKIGVKSSSASAEVQRSSCFADEPLIHIIHHLSKSIQVLLVDVLVDHSVNY